MIKAALLILLGFFLIPSYAKTLYVDGTKGSDRVNYSQNNENHPWATIGRAVWGSTSIKRQKSSQAAQAGDKVIIKAGTYTATQGVGERYLPIWNPKNSGTKTNPIIFKAHGEVILRSKTQTRGEPVIGTYQREFIVWDGFIIDEKNINTKSDTGPVVAWSSNNITIKNLTILGKAAKWDDNHNAIRIERSNAIDVISNKISGVRNISNSRNSSAIMLYYSNDISIERNEIYDSNGGIFVKGVNKGPINVWGNLLHDLTWDGIALGDVDGADVRNNTIYDSTFGITFIGYSPLSPANISTANNTIFNCSNGGIFFKPKMVGYTNISFTNNIISNCSTAIQGEDIADLSSTTFSHNIYHDNKVMARIAYKNYSLGSWIKQFGKDEVGSSDKLDPMFVDPKNHNYALQLKSPVLNSGAKNN